MQAQLATEKSVFLEQKLEELRLRREQGFEPLKPPKRGASRESLPNAANALRRGYIDQVAATEASLRAGWRYGCELFNNCCYICGESFSTGAVVQADHVIPPEHGGSTNAGNMLPVHDKCNDRKGNLLPEVFFGENAPVLELLTHFQETFDFVPDPTVYPMAQERVSVYMQLMKDDILRTRNARELAMDDKSEDPYVSQRLPALPIVNNLMRAVDYYLLSGNFAPSAVEKISRYCRRILHQWYSRNELLDMFTQSELTLLEFIENFLLTLTDHPDSFSRAHRAFRVLAQVFASESLTNLYADRNPLSIVDLRLSYEYVEGLWLPLKSGGS